MSGGIERFLLAIGFALASLSAALASDASPCGGLPVPAAAVAAADSLTLTLTDGRTVRLAGVARLAGDAPAEAEARGRLQALAAGHAIAIRRVGPDDRHGRIVAFVHRNGEAQSIQEALLAEGHAVVASRAGDWTCARRLLAAERRARAERRGLWARSGGPALRADRPQDVLAAHGRFVLVEGRAVSVRESGATLYVNFGRRWSEDFTATVPRRALKGFAAAGIDLKALAGRPVRVRGVVEVRGGPWIEVERPEQIEPAERQPDRLGGRESK